MGGTCFFFGGGEQLVEFVEIGGVDLDVVEFVEVDIFGVGVAAELDALVVPGFEFGHDVSYKNNVKFQGRIGGKELGDDGWERVFQNNSRIVSYLE